LIIPALANLFILKEDDMHFNILIIGGDAAGMSAASQARRIKKDISIGVLEKTEDISYAACGLPYFIGNDVKNANSLLAIDEKDFLKKKNVSLFKNHEVIEIDFPDKRVICNSNDKKIEFTYDKLVIATGAHPILPPIDGINSEGIFPLRTLAHGKNIKGFIEEKKPKKALIIGAGFIGLEMAEAFHNLSIDTTIIEMMTDPVMTMSPSIREMVHKELKKNKVTLHTETMVKSFENSNGEIIVKTDKGDHNCNIVIVSIGIAPSTSFLKNTEIAMTDKGAITVDEKSQSSIEDVYAAGDCATVKHLITGNDFYMPLGTTANKQGRVAGIQTAGETEEKFPGIVGSQFVKIFDLEIGKCGFNQHDASVQKIDYTFNDILWGSHARYYPNFSPLRITMTIDKNTGIVIGGEVCGKKGAALRSNTIAAIITAKMHVNEVAYLDLGYAPPFSPVWDPVNSVAQGLKL